MAVHVTVELVCVTDIDFSYGFQSCQQVHCGYFTILHDCRSDVSLRYNLIVFFKLLALCEFEVNQHSVVFLSSSELSEREKLHCQSFPEDHLHSLSTL